MINPTSRLFHNFSPFYEDDLFEEAAQEAKSEYEYCPDCGMATDIEYHGSQHAGGGWWKIYCRFEDCGWFVEVDAE